MRLEELDELPVEVLQPFRLERGGPRLARPTAAWSGAKIRPMAEETTSNDASSTGSASASPTSKRISAFLGGEPSRGLDQIRREVDAGHVRSGAGGQRRQGARAGADVEPAEPGPHAERADEVLVHRRELGRDQLTARSPR